MDFKARGSTPEPDPKLQCLSKSEGSGIPGVAVICVEIGRNTVAKAATWGFADAEERKLGERTGLDTPVVLAVNDEH